MSTMTGCKNESSDHGILEGRRYFGTNPHTYTSSVFARSTFDMVVQLFLYKTQNTECTFAKSMIIPWLCLVDVENGCHPSQWPIKGMLRGSPCVYFGQCAN